MSKIDDSQILDAICNNKTIKDSAESLGMSESNLYYRIRQDSFRELQKEFKQKQNDLLTLKVNSLMEKGFGGLVEIIENPKTTDSTKLRAIQILFNSAIKIHTQENIRNDKKGIFDWDV